MSNHPPTLVPVLTTEAARILDVSPETVRHWERIGILPALKTARGVRLFDRRDVERLARTRLLTSSEAPATAGQTTERSRHRRATRRRDGGSGAV